jgi:hypothetical protein
MDYSHHGIVLVALALPRLRYSTGMRVDVQSFSVNFSVSPGLSLMTTAISVVRSQSLTFRNRWYSSLLEGRQQCMVDL